MIRYSIKHWCELTDADKKKLRRLAIKDPTESGFKQALDGCYGQARESRTIVVIARDTDTGKWIGWSRIEDRENARAIVGVFVSWKYRRRGIGTKLIKKGLNYIEAAKAVCFQWDDTSQKFYNQFGAKRLGEGEFEGRSVFVVGT